MNFADVTVTSAPNEFGYWKICSCFLDKSCLDFHITLIWLLNPWFQILFSVWSKHFFPYADLIVRHAYFHNFIKLPCLCFSFSHSLLSCCVWLRSACRMFCIYMYTNFSMLSNQKKLLKSTVHVCFAWYMKYVVRNIMYNWIKI